MENQPDGTELRVADVRVILLGVDSYGDVGGRLVPVIPTLDLFT